MANAQGISGLSLIVKEAESFQDMADGIKMILGKIKQGSIQGINIRLTTAGNGFPSDINLNILDTDDAINVAFLQDLVKLIELSISTRKLTYNLPYDGE